MEEIRQAPVDMEKIPFPGAGFLPSTVGTVYGIEKTMVVKTGNPKDMGRLWLAFLDGFNHMGVFQD